MIFSGKHIRGHGRGVALGFPTINLEVQNSADLEDGIYAAWVDINNKTYKGALHIGPVPTFNQNERTVEVYLLDVTIDTFPDTYEKVIEVDAVERIRDVKAFLDTYELAEQIARDVEATSHILR